MQTTVFVNSITKTVHDLILVEASNGGPEGPPFVRFETEDNQPDNKCFIGKRYTVTIEEFK